MHRSYGPLRMPRCGAEAGWGARIAPHILPTNNDELCASETQTPARTAHEH